MNTPYDRLAKIRTNCTGHMTNMATTPIYGKNPLNIFFSGTKRSMALGLGFYNVALGMWYVALGMWALPDLHR